MGITVQLKPEVEARLRTQARARGVSLDAYLQTVIEQIAARGGPEGITPEEFDATLDALAEGSETRPILPPRAYDRESIYGDD